MAQAATSLLPMTILQQAAAAQTLALNSLTQRTSASTAGPIHHASQIGRFRYSPLAGVPVIAGGGAVANNTLTAVMAAAAAINGISTNTTNPIEQDIYAVNNAYLQQITGCGKNFYL